MHSDTSRSDAHSAPISLLRAHDTIEKEKKEGTITHRAIALHFEKLPTAMPGFTTP